MLGPYVETKSTLIAVQHGRRSVVILFCMGALGAGSGLLIGAVCGRPTVLFSATLGTNFALASCCFCCTSLFCSLLPLHWSIQSSVFMAAKGIEQQEKNLPLFFSMGSAKVDSIL